MASIKPVIPGTPEKQCRIWRVRVSVGQKPNFRIIERIVRGPKAKAKEMAARLETDNADDKLSSEFAPLGKVLARYIRLCEATKQLAPKTLADYRRYAKWLTEQVGATEIRKLSGTEIDDLMTKVAEEKGQSSADHYFRFLRAVCRQSVRWRLVAQPPTDQATAPSAPETEVSAPEAHEVRRALDVLELARNNDLSSLVWTAAVTGTRRGGLAGLTIGDLDFDKAEIIHRHAISRVGGVTYVRPPKSKKTKRTAIDPVTLAVLDQQVRRLQKRVMLAGGSVTDRTYIWSDEPDHSEPLNPDRITGRWIRLAKKENLPHRFHDLRHFAATIMLDAGISPVVAASQLTHSSPAITEARYAHVISGRGHDAAGVVAASLRG